MIKLWHNCSFWCNLWKLWILLVIETFCYDTFSLWRVWLARLVMCVLLLPASSLDLRLHIWLAFASHIIKLLNHWLSPDSFVCSWGWGARPSYMIYLPHFLHHLFQCSDTAYTNFRLDSHTDGNYFSEAPGTYIVCCVDLWTDTTCDIKPVLFIQDCRCFTASISTELEGKAC